MSEHAEQPMPTPGRGETSVQALVRADLVAREAVGIERYGRALQPYNGRNALRDLYEEQLDGACYTRQLLAEQELEFTVAAENAQVRADNQRLADLVRALRSTLTQISVVMGAAATLGADAATIAEIREAVGSALLYGQAPPDIAQRYPARDV